MILAVDPAGVGTAVDCIVDLCCSADLVFQKKEKKRW